MHNRRDIDPLTGLPRISAAGYAAAAWRETLFKRLDNAPKGSASDDTAETDRNNYEVRHEAASGDALVDAYAHKQGLDPAQDPWHMMKMLSGESIGRSIVADGGRTLPYDAGDPPTNEQVKAFIEWSNQFDSQVIDTYIAGDKFFWSDKNVMARDLNSFYGDNRDAQRIRAGITTGLSFDSHADRMLSIIKGATSTLDIGMFQFEEPTIISAVADRIQGGLDTRIHMHDFNDPRFAQKTIAKLSKQFFGTLLGQQFGAFTVSSGTVDHFKLFSKDIGGDVPDRAFLITSANITGGAIGRTRTRSGQRGQSSGFNLESSYYLDYSAVTSGRMSEGLFKHLTDQAAIAGDWVKDPTARGGVHEMLTFGADTYSSKLLTGRGFKQEVKNLLHQISTEGGTMRVFTANAGATFLTDVEQALRSGNGTIELILGSELDGKSFNTDHDAVHDVYRLLAKLRKESPALADRLTFTAVPREFIHTNMVTVESGSTQVQIQGSNRFSDAQYNDNTDYRNLSTMLTHGADYDLSADLQMEKRIVRIAKMTGSLSAGLSGLRNAELKADLDSLTQQYGLRQGTFGIIKLLNRATGAHDTSYATAQIGGVFNLSDRTGHKGSVNLSGLMNLSLVSSKFGNSQQIYIPELSKFIGTTVGADVFDTHVGAMSGNGLQEFGALETVASAISMINEDIQERLNELSRGHGAEFVKALLMNPIHMARLKHAVKYQVRDTFKNFAGFEKGTPAFGAKAHARMVYLRDANGNLNMRKDPNLVLDAKTMDRNLSGVYRGKDAPNKFLSLRGALEYVWSAGHLARFGKTEASTARIFDLSMTSTLPMTTKLQGEEGNEYLFLLPASKLEQLPQRLQNIMATRNLNPIDISEQARDVSSYSKLASFEDGKKVRMRGVQMNMLMIPGMTGDNAFIVAERMRGQYFADESYRLEVSIDSKNLKRDSLALIYESIDALVAKGSQFAYLRGEHDVVITAQGLESLRGTNGQSTLSIADHLVEGSTLLRRQNVDLRIKDPNQVLILNREPGKGISIRKAPGKYVLSLIGQIASEGYSGMRTLLGAKDPFAFIQQESNAWKTLERILYSADNAGALNHLGLQPGTLHGFMGSGTVKYGQAFIETGIRALETGAFEYQMSYLSSKGHTNLIGEFRGLFDSLERYMDPRAAAEFQAALGSTDSTQLKQVLKATSNYIKANGSISMHVKAELQHISAAALAFGVHAMYFTEIQKNQLAELQHAVNPDNRQSVLATQAGNLQLLGAIPLTYTTSFSAAATAMSSRERVNFLNYHAGGYTDAFFDIMALDSKVKNRGSAFKELSVGGLLDAATTSEFFLAREEFNAMTYFQEGFENEFGKITKLTRELQGHGKKALTMARINEIGMELDATLAAIETEKQRRMAEGLPVFETSGSMSSAYTQAFLRAQEKAGITKGRSVIIPEIGYMDKHGIFQYDLGRASEIRMREVRFLSPKALKALGSFEDYSAEIQTLQVEIERRLHSLRGLYMEDMLGTFTYQQRVQYQELMGLVETLKLEQRKAASTELQKTLGGQLAMAGKNMIAGTLPHLPTGYMLLGEEPWEFLKEGIKKEVIKGLRRSAAGKGVGENLLFEAKELLYSLEQGMAGEVLLDASTAFVGDRSIWEQEANRADHLNTKLKAAEAQADKYKKSKGSAAFKQATADIKIYTNALNNIKVLMGTTKGQQLGLIDSMLEDLLGNIETRAELTRGLFQRAGAPMGPLGMLLTKIMLVDEYNDMHGDQLKLDKDAARRAMFIFPGAMAMNLGDFDGDTASVSWLQKYSELNTMRLINSRRNAEGRNLSAAERARLGDVKEQLKYSTAEIGIRFARYYTGWDSAFSESALYVGRNENHLVTEQYKNRVHQLRAMNPKNLNPLQEDFLNRYNQREAFMYNLAVASNKYVADIYELSFDIAAEVHEISQAKGVSSKQAYIDYFSGIGPQTVMAKRMQKAFESMNNITDPGGSGLKWQELVTYFSMTSYASTLLMGKVFDAQYTAQLYIDQQKSRAAYDTSTQIKGLLNNLGLLGEIASGKKDLTNTRDIIRVARRVVNEANAKGYDAAGVAGLKTALYEYHIAEQKHSNLHGLILVAQQMAREAIKPKKGSTLSMKEHIQNALREADASGTNSVASVIEYAEKQVRVVGLNALNKIIDGKSLAGDGANTQHWGDSAWKTWNPETKQFVQVANADETQSGWDKAFHEIREALVDYYSTQIEKVQQAGMNSKLAETLFGIDSEGLNPLFGDNEGVKQARQALATQYNVPVKDLNRVLSKEDNQGILNTFLGEYASKSALAAIDMGDGASVNRENRNRFMKAIATGDYHRFNLAAGTLSLEDKLRILQGSSARGKLSTESGMAMVLEDIFHSVEANQEGMNKLRETASRASTSATFAEQIVSMFNEYRGTGNLKNALERAARYAGRLSGEEDVHIAEEEARIKQERAEQAGNNAALAQLKNAAGALKKRKRDQAARQKLDSFEGKLADMVEYREARAQARGSSAPVPHQTAAVAGNIIEKVSTTKLGQGLGGFFSNVSIPVLMIGGVSGAGAYGESTGFHGMAEAYGEMSAMAIGMANPSTMLHSLTQTTAGNEVLVRTGIMASSFVTGMVAAHYASKASMNAATKMGIDKLAGLASLTGASVAGMFAGMVVGLVGESIAINQGWIKPRAIQQVEATVYDLASQFVSTQEELDDDLEHLIGEGFEEEHEITLADGEVTAREQLYVTHSAAKDSYSGQGEDTLTDPDTYVAGMAFESSSNSGDSGMFNSDYDGASRLDHKYAT